MIAESKLVVIQFSIDELLPWILLGLGVVLTLALLGFLVFMVVRERSKSKEE